MTFSSVVQAAYGGRMKRAGLVRRRRSFEETRALRDFFLNYADETTKTTYIAPEDVGAESEEEYLRAVVTRSAPLRPEIDYIPFRSRVVAFGSAARPEIYGTHDLEKMSEPERMEKLRKWWVRNTADLPKKAHHMVFSLDPRLVAAMTEAGASADSFLLTAVGNAFSEFQSKFHPSDQLGYMVALHHDRAHIHAHVLVHPLTKNGVRVNLGVLRRYHLGDRVVDVPNQQVLKDVFEREAEAACERYLPRAPETDEAKSERRAEAAEELMLIARIRHQPGVPADLPAILQAREGFLRRDDYVTLIREGRNATAHLILENLADGKLFELKHNFAKLHDRATKARFETAAQARATLGMFSTQGTKTSTLYLEGIEGPFMRADPTGADENRPALSFLAEVNGRTRHFQLIAESNKRLRQEVASLRARILHEDRTETECIIDSANTVLTLMHATAPTWGEGPDILSLWTPAPDGEPRLDRPGEDAVRLEKKLSEVAAALASQHQPLNLAEHRAAEIEAGGQEASGEIHPYRIVAAPPSFLAHHHEVKWDDLFTLKVAAPRRPRAPDLTPG